MLLNGAVVDARNENLLTPLHLAALKGNLARSKAKMMSSKIICQFDLGHVQIMDLLIRKGADVQAIDIKGCTPLHYAAVQGKLQIEKI